MRPRLYLILFAHIIAFSANMLFLFLFLARGLKVIYSHHSSRLYHLLPFLAVGLLGYIFVWIKPKAGAPILILAATSLFVYYLITHDFKYTLWMFCFPFFLSGLLFLIAYQPVNQHRYID